MTTDLPGIAFAMRYPDDVGLVWASMARIHGGVVRELADAVRACVCFPVLTGRPAFDTPWAERVACDWYDTRSTASRARIRALARDRRLRAVVYWSCPGNAVDLRFLHGLGLRTIDCEVDSFPPNQTQPAYKRLAKHILRGWLKWGVHDFYVANARHQRRFLLDFAGLPPERVETVVDGVDVVRFAPGPRPDPAALGVPPAEHYVISVSQARPEKRIDVLIDAARQIVRERPDLPVAFVHVGGGQCLEEWKARAAPLGARYHFAGTQSDVVPYMRLATVFAHAAERESFGYVVAEAMACGKPVVAAKSPGPSEIVEPGVTGLMVEPGDATGLARALLALLDDPDRRDQMGTLGRDRCLSLFDSRRQSGELARIIRRVARIG